MEGDLVPFQVSAGTEYLLQLYNAKNDENTVQKLPHGITNTTEDQTGRVAVLHVNNTPQQY